MKGFQPSLTLLIVGAALAPSVEADVIAGTDFTGRTVSGLTVSNIPWTTLGVEDPGNMTAIGPLPGIFDTANSQGHFAPDRNVGNEGPWSVDVPLVLAPGFSSVTLESVDLDWQHFNNSGVFQGPSRSVDWSISVSGSVRGLLAGSTVSALNVSGTSGIETLTFSSPLFLPSTETYLLNIVATGSNATGNNTGLDGVTIHGSATAESDSLVLKIARNGADLDFAWNSRDGKLYDLLSATDLSSDASSWEVYEANQDVVPSGTGRNTLAGVPLSGTQRFFVVLEKDAP